LLQRRDLDRVALAGVAVSLAALPFGFVTYRPNRISGGVGFHLWRVAGAPELALVAALLAAVVLLSVLAPRRQLAIFAAGMAGNAVLLFAFLLAAAAARQLASPAQPFARTSLGPGAWILGFGGYMVLTDSGRKLAGRRALALPVGYSGFALLALLLALGRLDALSILQEYHVRAARFRYELLQHLLLAGVAVGSASVIGIVLGILALRRRRAERPIFFAVNTVQTIPSLALFGLMIAPLSLLSQRFPLLRQLGIQGIGSAPALIALTLYALLPVARNTYTSLKIIDPAVIEAGIGMGMSRRQRLWRLEVPLALPIIISGIRTSSVQAVGNTAVAALIGAGGLGVFVFQGLGEASPDLILLGAVPVILLAVAVDRLMYGLAGAATPRGLALRPDGAPA
jgi:osmoprotectant transport system permease protein